MKTPWASPSTPSRWCPASPGASGVSAGLKQDQDRVTNKKLLAAKTSGRRGRQEKCGSSGWEVVEAPQKNDFSASSGHCYDGENFYMNFMADKRKQGFCCLRGHPSKILDSIKVCTVREPSCSDAAERVMRRGS
jgi:hypothetical protein